MRIAVVALLALAACGGNSSGASGDARSGHEEGGGAQPLAEGGGSGRSSGAVEGGNGASPDRVEPGLPEGATDGPVAPETDAHAPTDSGEAATETESAPPVEASSPGDGRPPREASPGDATSEAAPQGGMEASTGSADGSLTADELAWLTPMNAARAMVGEAPLKWDPLAAEVALTYVSQCNYQHNGSASSEYKALGGSGGLGENIAAGAPTQSIAGAVSSWLSEASSYDHATNSCAAGKVCGHYTQIVWSATTAVGCARVSCTTNSPFGTFAGGLWDYEVCDFNPPGNVGTQAPY